MNNRKSFYVTTPIYYVNDKPHIGHAYTTILADVLSRFHRDKNDDTFFLTGTDEHGQKVQESAEARGIAPQEHCDNMVKHFKENWEKLNITNDFFIRTTFDFHKKTVQKILQQLWEKGEIYESEYGGYYCVGCERYYTEKELEDGKCPQHQKEPEYIKEKNYFFKMGKYQDWLINYIQLNPNFIQPEHRKNEVLGFLKNPLNDLCISRPKSRLKWGIELPFDNKYVTYVWFDALLNYVTGIGYGQDQEKFNKFWPANYHLIGKDIVTTHCVYWPTMMKAIGIPMPKTIYAHGWWLMDKAKMSKSLNNIVSPLDLIDTYGVDSVRYYLIRDMMLGQDSNFTEDNFTTRYNAELANDFGNLANRVTTLIKKNYDSVVPFPRETGYAENDLINTAKTLSDNVYKKIEDFKLNQATDEIISFIRSINKYMEITQPWKLVKTDKESTGTILYIATEALRLGAQLLHPIMPTKIESLLKALPLDDKKNKFSWGVLKPGEKIDAFDSLFPRIIKKKKPAPQKQKKPEINLITFEEVGRVNLITAKVLAAEQIPETNKLLKLSVDTGLEKRQIVAGIADHYSPEEILGKNIVIVANLQPAKIRGVESQGMLLAAKKGKKLRLITIDGDIAPGASVG